MDRGKTFNISRVFATMNGVEGANGIPGVSGGDVRLIQILRRVSQECAVILSTSPMGRELCRRYGLDVDFHVIPVSDKPGIRGNVARLINCLRGLPRKPVSLAYSGGEHLYDVLPAAVLKLFRGTPWLALVHWVEGYPWKEKRGGTPLLHRYLYWLNRIAALFLVKYFADRVLAVSAMTRDKLVLEKRFDKGKIDVVYCGLDLASAMRAREQSAVKTYDAVFLKRLTYGKGVRDLIDIWARVVKLRPGARLQIIGDGPEGVIAEMKERARTHGIMDNVDFVGVVHDPAEKSARLGSSKVFILPSHEENWAIVIGEALAAGLPVVAYGLKEITGIWGDRVHWVPLGDIQTFAEAVVDLIDNPAITPLDDFLESLDWERIAQNELREMRGLANV
jgi:glycosyltransferase involved in cell wall biosynthesis